MTKDKDKDKISQAMQNLNVKSLKLSINYLLATLLIFILFTID